MTQCQLEKMQNNMPDPSQGGVYLSSKLRVNRSSGTGRHFLRRRSFVPLPIKNLNDQGQSSQARIESRTRYDRTHRG